MAYTPPSLLRGPRFGLRSQVEAMLRGDVSFLARTLLFRACDLHRLVVTCSAEGGAESNGELGLASAPVEAFLKDCEMLW